MSEISFGKALLSDALRISVLFKTVYIQTYSVDGVTFESANFITKRFSVEHIESIIKKDPSQLIIAYCNDNPIGVAEIIFDSKCSIRNIAIPELSKLYVLERFYGTGIGYQLMIAVEKEVLKKGFTDLYLEVYIHNPKAIAFYKRQGYVSIGTIDFPMESNTYKNFVMNKTLIANV